MIKHIFLPEHYNGYYLFSSRIIGIEITTHTVYGVQIKAHGAKRTVEKALSVKVESAQGDHKDAVVQALKKLFAQCDAYDSIISALPSVHVVLKRLTVPFSTREEIAQIIGFEIEPRLPFSLAQAHIDFIINAKNTEASQSEVLVAAVQKDVAMQHCELFELAELSTPYITVDILALCTGLSLIPSYVAINNDMMPLLMIGSHSTSVALLENNTIVLVRTLPKGTTHILKGVSSKLNIPLEQAHEELMKYGNDGTIESEYHAGLKEQLRSYFDEITFTLNSFTQKAEKIKTGLLLSSGPQSDAMNAAAREFLQTQYQLFNPQLIVENPVILAKQSQALSAEDSIALLAALPVQQIQEFNLAPDAFSLQDKRTLLKQLCVMGIFLLFFCGMLATHFYVQRKKFKQEITKSQQSAVETLKQRFKEIESNTLATVIEDAQEEIEKEEATWFAFSSAARSSMLTILLELQTNIDKNELGFSVEKVTITEGFVTLKARVRDHTALQQFEKALAQSPLLSNFEPQADPQFEMKITLPSPHREEV